MDCLKSLSVIETAVFKCVMRQGLSSQASIVDAPCGDGALARAFHENGFQILGVDIETDAQTSLGGAFHRADLNMKLPLPDDTYDLVVSVEGIEHLENPHMFLREVHRILKKEGRLVLTTPNVVSLRSRVRFMGSGFFHRDSMPLNETARHPLHHIGLRSFPQLRYDLHTLGFQLLDVSSTHAKPISYIYGIFAPWMFLYTLIAFRKEKDQVQRKRNREILRTLYSKPLLFGENLLLLARKIS